MSTFMCPFSILLRDPPIARSNYYILDKFKNYCRASCLMRPQLASILSSTVSLGLQITGEASLYVHSLLMYIDIDLSCILTILLYCFLCSISSVFIQAKS